jgi:chromosome segregation ATPase
MARGDGKATREHQAAQRAVEDAQRRVRQANDELSDANSVLKVATARLREIERETARASARNAKGAKSPA